MNCNLVVPTQLYWYPLMCWVGYLVPAWHISTLIGTRPHVCEYFWKHSFSSRPHVNSILRRWKCRIWKMPSKAEIFKNSCLYSWGKLKPRFWETLTSFPQLDANMHAHNVLLRCFAGQTVYILLLPTCLACLCGPFQPFLRCRGNREIFMNTSGVDGIIFANGEQKNVFNINI